MLRRTWQVLIVLGLVTSPLACQYWPLSGTLGPSEYQYPEELIRPTNEINFQELWNLEIGEFSGFKRWRGPIERRHLLAADLDGDGKEELLVETDEANHLLAIEEGQVVSELELQVPGRALLDLSQAVEGTAQARILSTGINLSLVDLSTGQVIESLGQASADVMEGEGFLFLVDLIGSKGEELIVSRRVEGEPPSTWETFVLDEQGRELWRKPIVLGSVEYIGDVDGDSQKEIVTPIWTIVGSQGDVIEIKHTKQAGRVFYAGDIDGDGKVELVAGLSDPPSTVGVYDLEGHKKWSHSLGETEHGVVGDVDGDGKLEIAVFDRKPHGSGGSSRNVARADHWIFLFDAQGKLLWNHLVPASGELYPGGFADVNGDGKDELVFFQLAPVPRTLYVYGVAP